MLLISSKKNDLDIIHVDVANDGDIYEFCINNLLPLLRDKGILILEGGSEERDNCEWMVKYNKPKIREVLRKHQDNLEIKVFSEFPSMTLIKYK